MNSDNYNGDNHVERELQRLTPRGSRPELREQVLAAVGRELSARPVSRWERRLGLAVAASILLGVVLNVWAVRSDRRSRARLYGPRPVPKRIADIAEGVESVTDAEIGQLVQQQLSAAWWSRPTPPPQSIGGPQQIFNEPETTRKEQGHERSKRDRVLPGGGDRDTPDCQRHLGLDHRFTA
ncbi:MAG: hypothetical protein ACYSWU_04750 [Planctomycetota bacterium]|jgi:hypothetical protein